MELFAPSAIDISNAIHAVPMSAEESEKMSEYLKEVEQCIAHGNTFDLITSINKP